MRGVASAPFWVIARRTTSRMEIFTATIGGQRTLPVFGFRDEAETFVFLEGLGGGWRPRDSSAGELISLLFGPCAHVDGVVLDPPPEICTRRQPKPVERKRFVALLVAKRGTRLSVREERRQLAERPPVLSRLGGSTTESRITG